MYLHSSEVANFAEQSFTNFQLTFAEFHLIPTSYQFYISAAAIHSTFVIHSLKNEYLS